MSEQYEKTMQYYDCNAQNWHNTHMSDDWWQPATDGFIAALPPDSVVLDAGCGTGIKTKYLKEKGIGLVVGLDSSEKMLDIARSYVKDAVFTKGDIGHAAGLFRKFDGIYCQAAFLHIKREDAAFAMKSFAESLKDNGLLYISTKCSKFDEEFKLESIDGIDYMRWFTYYKPTEMRNLVQDAGLQMICNEEVIAHGQPWNVLIARK